MLRKLVPKKKKANVEFSPIVLIAVVIGLLIFAPIAMRLIGTVTGTFFYQMNTTAPNAVKQADQAVETVNNFFDYLILIGMFVNVIMLFISAWYIDTNPAFIVLYIMFAFIFFLFIPNLLDAVDTVWSKMEDSAVNDPWGDTSLNLTFTDFIRRNMMMFSLIIMVLTGILIYAKFKLTQGAFT